MPVLQVSSKRPVIPGLMRARQLAPQRTRDLAKDLGAKPIEATSKNKNLFTVTKWRGTIARTLRLAIDMHQDDAIDRCHCPKSHELYIHTELPKSPNEKQGLYAVFQ